MEVRERGTFARHRDRGLLGVVFARRDEEVLGAVASDAPVVVVDEHVVVPAEQDPVGEIALPTVAFPLVEVVRFGLARV